MKILTANLQRTNLAPTVVLAASIQRLAVVPRTHCRCRALVDNWAPPCVLPRTANRERTRHHPDMNSGSTCTHARAQEIPTRLLWAARFDEKLSCTGRHRRAHREYQIGNLHVMKSLRIVVRLEHAILSSCRLGPGQFLRLCLTVRETTSFDEWELAISTRTTASPYGTHVSSCPLWNGGSHGVSCPKHHGGSLRVSSVRLAFLLALKNYFYFFLLLILI